jgi:asparagine synthase (glutamine-hydrolysing)
MCGIAGFTHKNRPRRTDALRGALAAIRHRGPDQTGSYLSESVSMGAVRLKIIDLAGGDQPMKSEDGHWTVIYNGEIYNHTELREELEGLGHRFASRCDTEVVLRAFMQWDTASFSRLRGMFAIALWNERERRLVLCRDRAGIKPLYYYRDGEDLAFGSELKAIFADDSVPRNLSHDGLSYFLSLNYVPAPYTLVEGIRKLMPGCWMEWRNGRVSEQPFWKLEFTQKQRPLEDAVAELDSLLRDSVREHLVADVPLGLWVSGGMDSSTMLHYASQLSSSKLKTFSISFPGRSFDERKYFRAVADVYGSDHHELEIGPELDMAPQIERMLDFSDEPSADAGALPVWLLSGLTRQHVTVALSGEGADELFAGYQTYLADQYAARYRVLPKPLRYAVAGAAAHWPASDEKISLGYKVRRFAQGGLMNADAAHCYWNGTFSAREKSEIAALNSPVAIADLYAGIRARGLNRYLDFDTRYYLGDDILYKSDRMSMAHSLEVRVPFLDHRVIEFAGALPESYKLNGSRLKFILRELMRNKLPDIVINRGKQGLDIPIHDWFRTSLRGFLLDTLSPEALRATRILNADAIGALISAHLERKVDAGYHLWGLVILMLWARRWKIDFAPALQPEEALEGVTVH